MMNSEGKMMNDELGMRRMCKYVFRMNMGAFTQWARLAPVAIPPLNKVYVHVFLTIYNTHVYREVEEGGGVLCLTCTPRVSTNHTALYTVFHESLSLSLLLSLSLSHTHTLFPTCSGAIPSTCSSTESPLGSMPLSITACSAAPVPRFTLSPPNDTTPPPPLVPAPLRWSPL
jgi:hypothetical protein